MKAHVLVFGAPLVFDRMDSGDGLLLQSDDEASFSVWLVMMNCFVEL